MYSTLSHNINILPLVKTKKCPKSFLYSESRFTTLYVMGWLEFPQKRCCHPNPRTCECDSVWEEKLYRCAQVKMRSSGWDLILTIGVLIRRGEETQIQKHREKATWRQRQRVGWCAYKLRTSSIASEHQELEEQGRTLPYRFRREGALSTPGFRRPACRTVRQDSTS